MELDTDIGIDNDTDESIKIYIAQLQVSKPSNSAQRLKKNLEWLYIWAVVRDNLWERRGGKMVNGVPWEVPESNQCTPKGEDLRSPEGIF